MIKACVVCSGEFEVYGRQKTCSSKCSNTNEKEKARDYTAKYRANNRDKIKKQKRDLYAANPEKGRKRAARYRADNRDKINKRRREQYAVNPEKTLERHRRQYTLNPEKYREQERARNAIRKAALSLIKDLQQGIMP